MPTIIDIEISTENACCWRQNADMMCGMDWKQSKVSFLFTDLDLAVTFMDVADTSDLRRQQAEIMLTLVRHTTPFFAYRTS